MHSRFFVSQKKADHKGSVPPGNACRSAGGLSPAQYQRHILQKLGNTPPFTQIEHYAAYVNGRTQFETHQGVKGLEFPRVMIIIDDNEARGFLFSYDKLFGAKDKTATDMKNEGEGNDTSLERSRRLFYVTCSRTEKSLAIIMYSTNPEKVRDHVLSEGWFENNEVEILT